ncbi:hypothetical protein ACFL5O_01130 [Myxococcota bacterium]
MRFAGSLLLVGCTASIPAPSASPTAAAPRRSLSRAPAPPPQVPPSVPEVDSQDTEGTASDSYASEAAALPPEAGDESIPPAPPRSPKEVLTQPNIAFLIDYANSAPHKTATATCHAKSDGDPQAQATCLQEARSHFKADVWRLGKARAGRWKLTIYRRTGTQLAEIYVGSVQLADESENTVRITFGAGKGARPVLAGGSSAVVGVPDDHSLRLDDPTFGLLIYRAKMGLVGD